ncbi:non-ribosomal peptide synthetase [Mastigocoleus testarum]|uniref:Carrier domain-containing protein n=1 Tax=Mastigocoleus testarum BC008 TaxID=371196 RepID=A0A0V7ZKD3_9CYAN|nr:non-ribosomal peptide synthetase [Mastigocoleus testarum]KST65076.1 hypothetical protein BC008_19965 [Mastigocoleus testarum BC008]
MKLVKFLQELSCQGVKFSIKGEELCCDGSRKILTPTIVAQLQENKASIIQLLKSEPNIFNVHPLSHGQKALWFTWQLEPESTAYNQVFSARICNYLDVEKLRLACLELVERHPCLRSTFPKHGEQPIQKIHQIFQLNWQHIDASDWDETELYSQVTKESKFPFDIEKEAIIRIRLFTISSSEYILLITIHHIATDAWSLDIMLSELPKLYQAQIDGVCASLPALKNSYSDYVYSQNEMLSDDQGEKLLRYWESKLKGELPALNLPTDKPRPAIQIYNDASINFQLSEQLTQKLKQLAIDSDATLYMTLLAAFEVFLYRYTGTDDILVGSPFAGRLQPQFREIVGNFVNLVVLRDNLSNNPSFKEFLNQICQTVNEALTNQNYPFSLLLEKIQPYRDLSRSPIFQASFALQKLQQSQNIQNLFINEIEENIDWGGLKLESFEIPHQQGHNDLDLEVFEDISCIKGRFKYNTHLFNYETIERMVAHFQNLLEAIVENPSEEVSSFTFLSEEESHQLLVEWNDTAYYYPKHKCIHQLFEEQVEKTPDALAVVFESESLTYEQLNQRANQLAHHLQSLSVKPEVLVGICVERSIEMVVGLLGILKAGGAYVPLDPNYPQERLSYMLEDSAVGVLITQSSLVESLPEHNARVVCLDSDWGATEQQSKENIDVGVNSDHLAYVIYTSGSTGKPKGVMIQHNNVMALLHGFEQVAQKVEFSNSTSVCSYSFDLCVWELFSSLCFGQTLHILDLETLTNPKDFADYLIAHNIHTTYIPPALLQNVAIELEKYNQSLALNRILVGVEPIKQVTLESFYNMSPEIRIVNGYGPTETTICATFYNFCGVIDREKPTPIGSPVTNYQIYILDSHLQPVPVGVAGELYIGGDGLARGYLNRPQLTSEKFIQSPFDNSERLYKTGDLARYLPDGNISFIGRIDNQVKIRGFRIELGEIEAVLTSHPQVNQAVVIATGENTSNKRLVAYVIANSEITTQQLREYLKAQLPDYMVPTAFITLDRLPLTPNGKIDRKALPELDGGISRENEYIAPRTQSEQIIANIFAQVLNIENIGIEDNFFELGGHSLLATQLISRIRSALSIEIPLRVLFESPTVAKLDQTIRQLRNTNNGLTLPPIQPRGETGQIPLSWAQERLWFLNQLEGKSATYNMPLALRISGNLNINALQEAASQIVQRHEVLRTSFQTENGKPIQVIEKEATMKINLVDLQQLETTQRENSVIEQAQLEATTPFDLENPLLIRCSLLQLSPSEYVLLLTTHHIISDGWSIGVLIQELSTLYQAFIQGEESPLASLPIQYGDFAIWQKQYLSGEVLSTQLDYWKQQLSGAPDLLQLPTDFPRPTVQSYQGRTINFSLNTDLTTKLQTLSRSQGTTLFMTLYGAFSTLLYRYSGQSDILIGSPIANRNRSEIEGLIGFFVNTLVLRTNFENNPSFKELLSQVRETTLKAYEHQDVPVEQVVEALQPQRSLSYSPLFQVMFALQNAPIGDVELPGVALNSIQLESTIAKFDLTLSITETDQGLLAEWEYNTDLFDGLTIERMADHFQNLLQAIVENPSQKIGSLPLLSESERHQLLVEWNDTATNYPKDKCIHQLFEEQVEKTPDAIAVVFESESLTYEQLNQRANQLAHHLQSLGVQPEVLVGICVERSIEMVVGLLGILKAGGAYVPLDPNYPQERLSYMLEDSAVGVLITQSSLVESLPEHNARVVCLGSDWGTSETREATEQQSKENIDVGVNSDHLAYVIYTSGSTGKPKGVMIQHNNVMALLHGFEQVAQKVEFSNSTSVCSYSFDLCVWELFSSLCFGQKLHILDLETLTNPKDFADYLIAHNIHTTYIPPSLLQDVAIELEKYNQSLELNRILVGVEPIKQVTLESFYNMSPEMRIINGYGPTETTVCATFYNFCGVIDQEKPTPIGSPVTNYQIYILDSHLQPVPVGVPGEIYIGGDGLARGYLNRPQLTSEKFIQSPFDNSKRLYKTGDLARYLPDGNISFIGRIDNQVKIRGFRIELGEIEAVLTSHPQVNQAVVIATGENTSNKRLVAYVVANSEITTQQLREYLKTQLPDYMVPSAFVTLDSLPLTPNGKIDRKALPTSDINLTRSHEYVPPQTETEKHIAGVLQEVLQLEKVSINDNLFELGANSLTLVTINIKLRQILSIELPLVDMFTYPNIKTLSQHIVNINNPESLIKEQLLSRRQIKSSMKKRRKLREKL